jgi:hypothetical protein
MEINAQTTIEDLVGAYPAMTRVLLEKGIRCVICGEPIWGTLEEAAREKGYNDDGITDLIRELNDLAGRENR